MSDEKPTLLASTMSLADCLASVRVEQAAFTARGHLVKPGNMAVEGGVLYVHPLPWGAQPPSMGTPGESGAESLRHTTRGHP